MTVILPYRQRVTIPDKSLEEVYDTAATWLQYSNWILAKDSQQNLIEARYNADAHMFQVGPQDNFPKRIEIRLQEMGKDVRMDINITQEIGGMGDRGYLYWGMRLQDLYEMLGVKIDEAVLSELVPEGRLRKVINSRNRMIMAVFFAFIAVGWILWEYFSDIGIMYAIVLLGPILVLIGLDLQVYRNLSQRMRKRHKIN